MDVAADEPVVALRPCVVRRRLLEALNVPEAGTDAELDSLHERPVWLAEPAPHVIYGVIHSHYDVVQSIAQSRKPWGASNDPVEAIAMSDEQPLAERGPVYPFAMHFELAVENLGEHREARIVVAGNVYEPGTGTAFRQQRPHYV